MPLYYRDDGHAAARSAAVSPDYYYSGGSTTPYVSGAIPNSSNTRLPYQSQSPYYPPPHASTSSLHPDRLPVQSSRGHSRSLPPPARRRRSYRRDRSPSTSSRYDDGPHSPLGKARHVLETTFSNSSSGLGVGVIGAIVGGLMAREANEATSRSKGHGRRASYNEANRSRLVSTLLGAAVGGFGANALEKRIGLSKDKTAEREEVWERKWQKNSRGRRLDRDEDPEEDRGRRRSQRRSRETSYGHGPAEAVYGRYDR